MGNIDETPAKPRLKSAVSAGNRQFVAGGDGRSVWARRHADVVAQHVLDLGGSDYVSEAMLSLCKRAATLTVQCEMAEARMAAGEVTPQELDLFNRLVGNLRRCLSDIGLQRVARETEDPFALLNQISAKIIAEREPSND